MIKLKLLRGWQFSCVFFQPWGIFYGDGAFGILNSFSAIPSLMHPSIQQHNVDLDVNRLYPIFAGLCFPESGNPRRALNPTSSFIRRRRSLADSSLYPLPQFCKLSIQNHHSQKRDPRPNYYTFKSIKTKYCERVNKRGNIEDKSV